MSLKGFHLFFITAAILLSFGIAWLEYSAFRQEGAKVDAIMCVTQALLGLSLIGYGVSFMRKSRGL